ncbi:MAG: exodeoxyribonuclease III [Geminicoccaceae bacterium]|nr:exodeoxyribonuclease III [Geminicoccaceae bacterium]
MRIVTWNVNSIRKREEIVLDWLDAHAADVLLLQETKVVDGAFPRSGFEARGYHLELFGQPGLNGVAIASRTPLDEVRRGLPGDDTDTQARYVEARTAGLIVASVYVPNGTAVGSDKFAYKLRFLERLRRHATTLLETERPFVVAGDYNVAPDPIDVFDPEELDGTVCYHPDERARLRELLHLGLYDGFRARHASRRQYTWWDMRGGAWERDEGMRIDHLLLSPQAVDRLKDAGADPATRAGKGVSDHIPVWVDL